MPTVFDRLLAPAMPILEQIESMRPKHGNETLAWLDWVRTLVYVFTRRCGSRNAWAVALANAEPALHLPAVPRMTRSDSMHRFPPTLLRHALQELLTSRDLLSHPELALLGQTYAVDGSEFPLINGLTLPKSNEVLQRVKLHLKFSLSQMVAVDFLLSLQEPSERKALRRFLQKGATYVLDRGYMAFTLLRDVSNAQAFVVMRAYQNIVVETVTELPVQVPAYIAQHWSAISDRMVRSEHADAQGMVFRLVEFTLGTTCYKLITNRTDLTTFQVMLLYAYRWQIELIFRFFKHTMESQKVISLYPWGIENYFVGMLLTAILHLYFKQDCLHDGGYRAPTDQELAEDLPDDEDAVSTSTDAARPTHQPGIARFMEAANQKLALFWKLPKHWLATLADYLHRSFTPQVVQVLNQRAIACYYDT
jgi:DDE family transposase